MITLYRTPIAWRAFKQPTVTMSSTEAELFAFTEANKETIAIIQLFAGMRFYLYENIVIWYDNQQTIRFVIANILRLYIALRHVDIHNAWVRQEV